MLKNQRLVGVWQYPTSHLQPLNAWDKEEHMVFKDIQA